MASSDHVLARYLHEELMTLVEPLHEALATADVDASKCLPVYTHAGAMSFLHSGIMRLGVREYLTEWGLDGWVLGGNPNRMGQLTLSNRAGDLALRFLKDGKPPARTVPNAGSSPTRRAFWRNTPMLNLGPEALFEPPTHNLLLLWSPSADGAFNVRAVRPLEPGRYSGQIVIDFSLDLAPTRTAFEELRFVGEDHEEDLLIAIDTDEELEGEGGAAG
jgi:hypothetical protein